jgi:hypothetical protein
MAFIDRIRNLIWGMIAHNCENSANVPNTIAVGLEQGNRSAACGCNTEHLCGIFIPGEMVIPIHLTRIEEWDDLIGGGVEGCGLGVFAVVAGLASEGEVFGTGFAAFTNGIEMIHHEWVDREFGLAAAIFAHAFGPIEYEFAEGDGDVFARHR